MIVCVSGKLAKICRSEPQVRRISHEEETSTTTKIIICFQRKVKFRKSLSHVTFLEYIYWMVVAAQEKACPEMPREGDAGKVCG